MLLKLSRKHQVSDFAPGKLAATRAPKLTSKVLSVRRAGPSDHIRSKVGPGGLVLQDGHLAVR